MTEPSSTAPDSALLRRVIAASGLGTLIEFFDYASYSYLATTLAVVFFPSDDPTTALLNTFAVFAASFLMRPIGALVWGHLGDRLGRRRTLATTIVIMSLSTFAIGLVPGHAVIGVAAPALLLLFRLTQSFSAAGEYSGAGTFIAEYSPNRSRGRLTSVVPMCAAGGFLLASVVATVLYHFLSSAAMTSWGWRVPFLIAGPLGVVALYMRYRLEDTPHFTRLVENQQVDPSPVRSGLRANLRSMGLLLLIIALNAGGYYLLLGYAPTYLIEQAGMSQATATLAVTIALAVYVFIVPATAALSDRIGRRPALLAAGVLFLTLSYPALLVLSIAGVVLAIVVLILLLAIFSLNDGVFPAFLTESFATHSRYTGFSLPFNLGNAIFGGVAPYVATWLIARTGIPQAPAFYLMALAVLSLLAVALTRETARQPLHDTAETAHQASGNHRSGMHTLGNPDDSERHGQ